MERIDFQKQQIPFTQVANGVLYDEKLSLGAKTIYAYMYSKPDGWQFSASRIGQEMKVSKPTVLGHLSELKQNGYLIAQKLNNGRMLYKVVFPPIQSEPESKNFTLDTKAKVKKSHGEESLPISNKEVIVIKNNSESKLSPLIQEIIHKFEEINPANKRMYGNKTQRQACEDLVKSYGFEEVSKVIALLPQTNKLPFFPNITTPYLLWHKYQDLKNRLEVKKAELTTKKAKVAF